MRGATNAYNGKKAIVKMKDPGMAATVYLVQMLFGTINDYLGQQAKWLTRKSMLPFRGQLE